MIDEMRNLKYETLIKEVNKNLRTELFESVGMLSIRKIWSITDDSERTSNTTLTLIFDYDKLNNYGKMVIDFSRPLLLKVNSKGENKSWIREYPDTSHFKNSKNKMEAAKDFLTYCNEKGNRKETYKFIFWAMMVLTVDKTNSEEHLSLICDFARMLKITDDEIEDILKVIKVIYHEEKSDVKLKTETVQNIFSGVLALHNN